MDAKKSIDAGIAYLATLIHRGICYGGFGLRHGESDAWTTAIVGTTLAEFKHEKTLDMAAALIRCGRSDGGWGYNAHIPSDADTTLRAIQFLRTVGIISPHVIRRAQTFVISHQQRNGGIATYSPAAVKSMDYPQGGWTASHPCVSALALNLLPHGRNKDLLIRYLADLKQGREFNSYWWKGMRYFAHILFESVTEPVTDDSLDIALELLCKHNYLQYDADLCARLMAKQLKDGSFEATQLFRIPRPEQFLEDLDGSEEIAVDEKRILSTCAAVIALHRQSLLT